MSWNEVNKVDLRYAAVKQYMTQNYTKKEISETYGISRVSLDKWIERFEHFGINGLQDRSSRPRHSPQGTPDYIKEMILNKNEAKGWMAKKIHSNLINKHEEIPVPSITTIHNILKKENRTSNYKRYRRWNHPGKPIAEAYKPNDVFCVDYKGDFLLRNTKRCYPLTVTDKFSRALLAADAHEGTRLIPAIISFVKVFEKYGLPKAILSDNGVPFCNKGIDGISKLNVWWTELGIKHIRTQLGCPQQNGQHERMHREMKRLVTRPPGKNMNAQQAKLDEFKLDYNENLGHGGINEQTPMSVYKNSENKYLGIITEPDYPIHFDIRKVSRSGSFRFSCKQICVSTALGGKLIGLEEVDDGLHKIWFYDRFLGFYDEFENRLEDEPKRYSRIEKRK